MTLSVIQTMDFSYPAKLKSVLVQSVPQTLHFWGNLNLFTKPSVGIAGSRNVTPKGLQVTTDIAQQVSTLGWVVVSGHARGVDVTAHRVALECGAGTIIVLAEGLQDFRLRQELKKIAKPEQLLIISEFRPKAGWHVGNAMTRNKTIVGLSDAMVLIESRMEGGTFEAGKTALKYHVPLFVAKYELPGESAAGNEYFLQRGALPILKSSHTNRAGIGELQALVARKSR